VTVKVFLLVVVAASLHVFWNALAKKSREKLSFAWLVSTAGVVFMSPFFLLYRIAKPGPLGGEVWALAALSGFLQSLYFITLSRAYGHADLSVVYPLSRGIAPVLTAGAAGWLVGDAVGPVSGLAVAAVAAGAALVSAEALHLARHWRRELRGILLAFATGCIIAGYHLIDRRARALPTRPAALEYLFLLHAFMVAFLAPWVWLQSTWRRGIIREWMTNTRSVLAGGICVPLAYYLIVVALGLPGTNVTYVTAGRNVGILISTAAGAVFLKERVGWRRAAGACLIALGVAALVALPGMGKT
jgi:drug/metabolite transporter (DMT)-like permease